MNTQKELFQAKQAAGKLAASWIQEGMRVGLGTGSTAETFITALAERCRQGLKITAAATSERSAHQARQLGLDVREINSFERLDLTVDGADEINSRKEMIKGGGGALLREKILAFLSHEMVVIVDATKCVDKLGAFKLPVEVVAIAYHPLEECLKSMGYQPFLRKQVDQSPYVTDNGNYILDLIAPNGFADPYQDQERIRNLPGVIETGLFLGLAGRVIVGHLDGTTQVW